MTWSTRGRERWAAWPCPVTHQVANRQEPREALRMGGENWPLKTAGTRQEAARQRAARHEDSLPAAPNQHRVAAWWTPAMPRGPMTHLEREPATLQEPEPPLTGLHLGAILETLTRKQKAELAADCRCHLAWNGEIGAYRRHGWVAHLVSCPTGHFQRWSPGVFLRCRAARRIRK